MSEPFIGELRQFGFGFAPPGWALCDGQLVNISSNNALFSLLGTIYGGDGRTTFGLPDLRGRAPLSMGQGAGLSNYTIGQDGGSETTTLAVDNLPSHNHTVYPNASIGEAETGNPMDAFPSNTTEDIYHSAMDTTMGQTTTSDTGGDQPVDNLPPYLVTNWCIALEGTFPSRSFARVITP